MDPILTKIQIKILISFTIFISSSVMPHTKNIQQLFFFVGGAKNFLNDTCISKTQNKAVNFQLFSFRFSSRK